DPAAVFATDMTREEVAAMLGLPIDSRTVQDVMDGAIDLKTARRRADRIAHRHEETDYDDLLARGIDRDTARMIIEDEP
ncbi:MAG: DUF2293 domain-containing protein, partial [Planctomycetota bacterium]|nr:DUF2293 domain-containing protein [Planctomycetota bacterium]